MLRRLAIVLVGVAAVLVVLVGLAGAWIIHATVRGEVVESDQAYADRVARLLEDERQAGTPVSEERMVQLNSADTRMVVSRPGIATMTVSGDTYDVRDLGNPVVATGQSGDTTVTVVRGDAGVEEVVSGLETRLLLLLVAALAVAVVAALQIARQVARPVVQLARKAEALGRGRFDVEPVHSSIPEVRALGDALVTSARNLERHLERSRDAAQLTSHALRTPLTGMRLDLETTCSTTTSATTVARRSTTASR